jgi:hypothetical protein
MANFEDGAYPTRSYREWLGAWRYGAAANWANGTLDWKAEADFDRWHFPFVCGMCKRGDICGVPLQRCNGCRIVYYCSKAHQKKAWPLHKQICGQMRSLLSGANENTVHNAAEWKQFLFNGFGALRGLADDPSILDRAMAFPAALPSLLLQPRRRERYDSHLDPVLPLLLCGVLLQPGLYDGIPRSSYGRSV